MTKVFKRAVAAAIGAAGVLAATMLPASAALSPASAAPSPAVNPTEVKTLAPGQMGVERAADANCNIRYACYVQLWQDWNFTGSTQVVSWYEGAGGQSVPGVVQDMGNQLGMGWQDHVSSINNYSWLNYGFWVDNYYQGAELVAPPWTGWGQMSGIWNDSISSFRPQF